MQTWPCAEQAGQDSPKFEACPAWNFNLGGLFVASPVAYVSLLFIIETRWFGRRWLACGGWPAVVG